MNVPHSRTWRKSHPLGAIGAVAALFATAMVVFAHIHLVIAALSGVVLFGFYAVMYWAQRP